MIYTNLTYFFVSFVINFTRTNFKLIFIFITINISRKFMSDNRKLISKVLLEGWFAVDYMLFGENASKIIKDIEKFNEFSVLKNSFLINIRDIYKTGNLIEKVETKASNGKQLQENASRHAAESRADARELLTGEYLPSLKKELLENNAYTEEESKSIINKKLLEFTIDNYFFKLFENSNKKSKENKLFLETHKKLRDGLIEYTL